MFFPHRYKQNRPVKMEDKMWINPNSLQHFRNMHKHVSVLSSVETDISARWRVETSSKVQCMVANNVCAYYWKTVSKDGLFLQDTLGSCKGNDSVIQSWSSFLELFDNPHERQRISVITSGQQASLLGMLICRWYRVTAALWVLS